MQKKMNILRPAKVTLRNILAVVQAYFRKWKKTVLGMELSQHVYEQVIWRRIRVKEKSPICYYTGKCNVCGCELLSKTMEDRACSISEHPDLLEKRDPCYPPMMGKEEWNTYKVNKNIKFFE